MKNSDGRTIRSVKHSALPVGLDVTRLTKSLFGFLCVGFVTLGLSAQQTPPSTVKLPDGTILRVVTAETLSSGTNHQNDIIHFKIADEVKVGNVVVIAKDAPAVGHIIDAEPKGRWGHSGKLAFSVDYATAVDGSNVRLKARSSQGGTDSKGAFMLGLSGAFIHGKDITIPKGTAINTYVDGDHEVTLHTAGS